MSSIFLAHSSKDKRFVSRLAQALGQRGFRVWLDEAELLPGDSLFDSIGSAIIEMDFLGAVLSPNSIESKWVTRELALALHEEIRGKRVRVLPILYRGCDVPAFLRSRLWVDFTKRGSFSAGVDLLARRLGTSVVFENQGFEPWRPKSVRLGLRFGVLKQTRDGIQFAQEFIDAIERRASERPPSGNPEFRNNVLLAVLDTTPIKITEEDLKDFGDAATPHLMEFLVDLATRAQIISQEGGGLALDASMKDEAIDHFAATFHERFEEFQAEALTLFREMTRARMATYVPERASLWPMVALLALVIFDRGKVLQALWERALKPGASN